MSGYGKRAMIEQLRVHVNAADPVARARMLTMLRSAEVALDSELGRSPDTVIVTAGRTVDEAIEACHPTYHLSAYRLLLVADQFSAAGVLRAVRMGVRVMLASAHTTSAQLVAALYSVRHGEGRMPHDVLIRLLSGESEPPKTALMQPLTARQTTVLTLIADGYGNAAIARALSCSEHTVKNVIYDLMARLQVRNRAHAVAHAVRVGII